MPLPVRGRGTIALMFIETTPLLFGHWDLRTYDDAVFNPGHAWRRPGGPLGLLALHPGPHGSFQDDFAATGLHLDPASVDLRIASKRFLNLLFDVCRLGSRLHDHRDCYDLHALERAHG